MTLMWAMMIHKPCGSWNLSLKICAPLTCEAVLVAMTVPLVPFVAGTHASHWKADDRQECTFACQTQH